MAPRDLDGGTLGERHQHYNKLLKEAIANRQPVSDFTLDDVDVEKLLKIDLACHNKDVDYIISVLKNGDSLCVTRALAQSTWLVTDPQYAHIINVDFLQEQLFPYMSTKSYIKLKKHIRHNIRDESRAEQFYLYEKKPTDALKWLPSCSAAFIESKIVKHIEHCKIRTFKRLCEKSNIFEIVIKEVQYYDKRKYAQAATFLLKVDVDKYLDILEKGDSDFHSFPTFNDKATDVIMKKSRKRIIDKFDRYVNFIHIPIFSRFLKPDEIKTFLYTQAKKQNDNKYQFYNLRRLFNYDSLKYFIKRLPSSEQFDFVKKIFIDKEIGEAKEEDLTVGTEPYNMKKLCDAVVQVPRFDWYRFASFERAFEDITRLISKDLENTNKGAMLTVLISCADNNLQHIQTLVQYYLDKHKEEHSNFTLSFTIKLLQHTKFYEYDEKTWNLVQEIFKILKMYSESDPPSSRASQVIIDYIIIYHLIHDQEVPAVIKSRFTYQTLLSYANKLNEEQKDKVFRYTYKFLTDQLKPIEKEEQLTESIGVLEKTLHVLSEWKKQLTDFPFVIDKIKEYVHIKREKAWKTNLTHLYNVNKSWRKHMFEESVVMNPCEEVCLNALKHDPQLLERESKEIDTLRTNNAVSLQRLLAKLRTYWPHTLVQQWTDAYTQNLNKTDGHKATVRGLCTTLPQKSLLQVIEQYKPAQAKIDWNGVDDRVLSIQRFIAKNMHIARPQPRPDTILLFAKGDYLQFALPSLLAIFYNLSVTESQEHIPKLLDAPVSLQKHGIRLAFRKLDHEAVKKIFFDCWKASKNASIRAIIFKFTYELLCKEKDSSKAEGLWELIELFIDNLTFEEDKKIYELMTNVEKVPLNVRAKYLMKTYKFMKNLIQKVKEDDRGRYEVLIGQMAQHTREIMPDITPDFVTGVIQEFIDKSFFGSENIGSVYSSGGILSVVSAYLLCAKDENIQTEKYEKVFVPIMNRALETWAEKRDGKYTIRVHFQYLLTRLSDDLKEYVADKKMIIPVQMFLNIQDVLEKKLPISENYMMLTKWKLTVALAKLANKLNSDGKDWDTIVTEIAPEFGKICLDYLKEDVKLYFPSIYKLFSKVLNQMFSTLITDDGNKIKIHESMLADSDFVQGYLTTIDISSDSYSYNKDTYEVLWKQIFEHPSVEVKMHYYYRNKDARRYIE